MAHPDYIVPPERRNDLPLLEPVYPLTAGLSNKILQKAAAQALLRVPQPTEWQEPEWLRQRGWPDFATAVARLHKPLDAGDVSAGGAPRQRLAYDELLAGQLALDLVRRSQKALPGRQIMGDGRIRVRIADALPFALTATQRQALKDIATDMAAPSRMLRLLQGDVGSGKTVVALMALAIAVEAGAQSALMAPTEVLARQHLKTIETFGLPAGLRIALLSGREKGAERKEILAALAEGRIDILIGTHALFQEPVAFRDLALVVIDEQHRFGVHQRLALQAKGTGRGAELLVMTATPIPRTLLLTSYGDMDVSRLDEKPPGRKPITTSVMPDERLETLVNELERPIAKGAQVYWVCPLVAESEVLDMAAAEERHAELKKRFGDRVGLVHGRLSGKEKDRVMAAFAAGELSILVSTTVIEVGVDVPNASIMVIEHAERFGLAQLHQLRGRVGRGAAQSSCILLYRKPLSEAAQTRLNVMKSTEDGFVIAEEDLKLRGGGEVLGTRQSGLPEFRVARLPEDEALLQAARGEARLTLTRDPDLTGPHADELKLLLYLFERDDAVLLMRAG
jgi:ATP-dependent DNA helicase RecG